MEEMFPIEKSKFFNFWKKESKAIDDHKWFLSEKSGRDVGIAYARWNWVMSGEREKWIKRLKENDEYP